MKTWRRFKEIWLHSFTPNQNKNFRDSSTNEVLVWLFQRYFDKITSWNKYLGCHDDNFEENECFIHCSLFLGKYNFSLDTFLTYLVLRERKVFVVINHSIYDILINLRLLLKWEFCYLRLLVIWAIEHSPHFPTAQPPVTIFS